jgi:hypothetical protein
MARWMLPALAVLVLPMAVAEAPAHEGEHHGGGNDKGQDVCVFTKHGNQANHAADAKPANPGGGGGGGGNTTTCSKTYAKWTAASLDVYINSSGGPSTIDASTFESYVQHAFNEWSCHSGLGESVTINFLGSSAGAEITVSWGNLGTTGILGQAATSYFGGVISHSDITMNSNQSAFSWTAGPSPSLDADGCAVEVSNGNVNSDNYDLLSVLTHEIGHSLGISHPSNRCRSNDACYAVTMYSCTDAEEFMRRALNEGDRLSASTLYGADQ